jgi:hypothetical protein
MNHIERILYGSTLLFEVMLCALVYARELRLRLPFFSAYATVFLTSSLATGLLYRQFGYRSAVSYYAIWVIIGVNVLVRSLAIAEICWYKLRSYRGVWALAWRVLSLLTIFSLGHAASDAWGQPNWIAIYVLTIERDIGLTSVVILLAVLLIRNYYGLGLEPLQKSIALGILLLCTIDSINNTVLRDLLTGFMPAWSQMGSQIESANQLWNVIRASAFIVSMSIWGFALRRPLPDPKPLPELLPAEIYGELSPAVNLRLRAINDRLLGLLKP